MILVTGATGTIGSRLVELLLVDGEHVRALARDPEAARVTLGEDPEIVRGDFDDPDSLAAALAGADRLFLLTSRTPEPGGQLAHERALIRAATRAGVGHVVKLSALGADERSPVGYARRHREAEVELAATSLAHTVLRPEGFMQNFIETVVGGAFYTCAREGRVALVDTRDVAAVAAAVLADPGPHAGRTYALTGPAAVSFDDAAAALSAAAGTDIRHISIPRADLVEAMTGAGLPPWFADDLAAQYGVFAAGRGEQPSGDVAAILHREPLSVQDFAREVFAGTRSPHQNRSQLV